MRRLPTRSLPFQSRLHAFANGPDEAFRSLLRSSRECPILALSNSAPKSLIGLPWMAWDSWIAGIPFSFCQARGLIRSCLQTWLIPMGVALPVFRIGMVNVLLFWMTRRILPAQSVVPGWRGLFKLAGFTEPKPSQDTDKSFACRGTGRGGEGNDLENGRLEEDEDSTSPRP